MPSATTLPDPNDLAALYVLDSLKGFGPQKFKQVYQARLTPKDVIKRPDTLPIPGKIGDPLREQLRRLSKKVIDECKERNDHSGRMAAMGPPAGKFLGSSCAMLTAKWAPAPNPQVANQANAAKRLS